MSLLPKIRRCPCCDSINLIRVNGLTYINEFKSISDWTVKKIFNCKKCKEELVLLIFQPDGKEKLIWSDYFKCEDEYSDSLLSLQNQKIKAKKLSKKYFEVLKEINGIQNTISLNQTKLKIKLKIKNRGMLIRHV
tara:strand:- start:3493 stop:3897 length:405 start_codon:yes stop_codon:yes gene_type:complete